MTGSAAAGWWVLTRAGALLLLVWSETRVHRDVSYFARSLNHLHQHGLGHTLVEYPLPGLAVIAVPWLAARAIGATPAYVQLFAGAALATDAAFTGMLVRWQARRAALAAWLAGVPLLGAMSYFRFDLMPAVLVGIGVLYLSRRPTLAMSGVAVATAVKLWPVLVLPALLGGVRHRLRASSSVVAVVGGLALLGVAAAGWARLLSPLLYETRRGLQVEAVWATPAMVEWALDADGLGTHSSQFRAWQVSGPGVPVLLGAATLSCLVLTAALAGLWWRILRQGDAVPFERVVWTALAAVVGFLVFGKVLSPQYLLWPLPIAVAGLARARGTSRALLPWTVVLLVAMGLTHLIYPTTYAGLRHHDWFTGPVVSLLVARNGLLLWLLADAWRHAWRPASRPLPAGERVVDGAAVPS
jgi:hypothetical protein